MRISVFVLIKVYLKGRFLEVGLLGQKIKCTCSFVKYCHISSPKDSTNLHFLQQCLEVPVPHSLPNGMCGHNF